MDEVGGTGWAWEDELTAIAHEAELVAPRRNLASLSGAQRLAMALLREGIETVLNLGPHHPLAAHDLAWIAGDGDSIPFDLCCLALDINPDALRKLTFDRLRQREWCAGAAVQDVATRMARIVNNAPSPQWLSSRLGHQLLSIPVSIGRMVGRAIVARTGTTGRAMLRRLLVREQIGEADAVLDGEWLDGRGWLWVLWEALDAADGDR